MSLISRMVSIFFYSFLGDDCYSLQELVDLTKDCFPSKDLQTSTKSYLVVMSVNLL